MRACRSCGEGVARNAPSCPHCGHQFTSFGTWLVAVTVAFFVFAYFWMEYTKH